MCAKWQIQKLLDSLLETMVASLPKPAGEWCSQHSKSLALTFPECSVPGICVSESSKLWELEVGGATPARAGMQCLVESIQLVRGGGQDHSPNSSAVCGLWLPKA